MAPPATFGDGVPANNSVSLPWSVLAPFADLRGSNLFGADLTRVQLDDATRFDGALTQRARTWPRLTPEQQARAAAGG